MELVDRGNPGPGEREGGFVITRGTEEVAKGGCFEDYYATNNVHFGTRLYNTQPLTPIQLVPNG